MDVHQVAVWGHNEAISTNSSRLESPERLMKLEIHISMLFASGAVRQPESSSGVEAADWQKIPLR